MDLKETDILGEDIHSHWYYRAKAKAMRQILDGTSYTRILDVGAGSGFFSRHLLADTSASEAWCVDISYDADSDDKASNKPIHYRREIDRINTDLVLLMDVLEHVDDDVGLLRSYVDKVPEGSSLLISVPAFQFLWSGHDVFLEHKRRYTLAQLEQVVLDCGLTIKSSSYYFGSVFPIAATLRLLDRVRQSKHATTQLSKHNPLVNALLKSLCYAELPFMKLNKAAGLTVFCLAEKPVKQAALAKNAA